MSGIFLDKEGWGKGFQLMETVVEMAGNHKACVIPWGLPWAVSSLTTWKEYSCLIILNID
jgi:hypothetical protein